MGRGRLRALGLKSQKPVGREKNCDRGLQTDSDDPPFAWQKFDACPQDPWVFTNKRRQETSVGRGKSFECQRSDPPPHRIVGDDRRTGDECPKKMVGHAGESGHDDSSPAYPEKNKEHIAAGFGTDLA
jgi:hypothetical protein